MEVGGWEIADAQALRTNSDAIAQAIVLLFSHAKIEQSRAWILQR